MPKRAAKEKAKRKRSNRRRSIPTEVRFDPIDNAADNLADATLRESPEFKREKERLKRVAKKALSDSPFKGS